MADGDFDLGDLTLTDEDVDSAAASVRSAYRVAVNDGLEHSPDDAAEAAGIADLTGAPPEHVLNNLQDFKDDIKRRSAQAIVLDNPELISYLQSHPLAAGISGDDWANLDKFTRESSGGFFRKIFASDQTVEAVGQAISGAFEGLKQGLMTGLPEDPAMARAIDPSQNLAGFTGALASRLVYGGMDLATRAFNAAGGAVGGGIAGAARGVGFDDPEAQRISEALMNQGMAEAGLHAGPKPIAPKPFTAAEAARPWFEAGTEPPRGLHPEIDQQKAQINAEWVAKLEADLTNAAASTTRERANELFSKLTERVYGDTSIGIHADAVLGLYGDKLPEADDGILGWVPGIADQVAAARETGSDVQIPLKDWMAKVDPAVAKGLSQDIRIWPGGITAREAAEVDVEAQYAAEHATWADKRRELMRNDPESIRLGEEYSRITDAKLEAQRLQNEYVADAKREGREYEDDPEYLRLKARSADLRQQQQDAVVAQLTANKKAMEAAGPEPERRSNVRAVIDEALPSVRASAGLEPKFSMGDRKLKLEPDDWSLDEEGKLSQTSVENNEAHAFNVFDENKKVVGELRIMPQPKDKTLYVDWFGGQAGLWANSFGPALIRDIKRQLKTFYPDYEYLTGHRVSGARYGQAQPEMPDISSPGIGAWIDSRVPKERREQALSIVEQFKYADSMLETDPNISTMTLADLRHQLVELGADPMPLPKVRLAEDTPSGWGQADAGPMSPEDYQRALDIFQNGWQRQGGVEVNRQGPGFYTPEQMAIGQATYDEVRKLTGGRARMEGVAGIRKAGTDRTVLGVYQPQYDSPPNILVDLLGNDPKGIGRHEAIHFLKDYKLLKPEEWAALERAATDENWHDRYGINERYGHLDESARTEEAIAEAFREWAGQAEDVRPKTGVGGVFQKIWDFLDRIRQGIGKYLGREPTWDEVFQRVQSGEVGAREPGVPEGAELGQYRFAEGETPEERQRAVIEGITNLQAASVGMDKPRFEQLQALIRKRAEEDLAKTQERLTKEQAKRQTSEWKENRVEVAKEVSKDIHQRPDIAADLFIGSGELQGQKLRQRFTLAADALTDEQKAGLPEHYVSKNGLDPDHIAGLFGYDSGEAMVRAISELQVLKVDPEGKPIRTSEFLRKMVQAETDRRMEMRYGNLAENVLDAAKDQALSDSSVNVMFEEYRAVAESLGQTAFDRTVVETTARRLLNQMPLSAVSSFRIMQDMGRDAKNAERAMIEGNWADAAVHMERQAKNAIMAREARKLEGEMKKFEKQAKRLTKREQPSLPAEYTNWVHDILSRTGWDVKRSPEDLRREIEAAGSGDTLEAFVNEKNAWLQPVAVWDQLFDQSFRKPYKELTAAEFRAVRDSVASLVKVGRDELKIYRQGEAEDFAEVRGRMVEALKQFKAQHEASGGEGPVGGSKISELLRTYFAAGLQFENFMGRWDKFDPYGVWTQYVMRDLIDGVNQSDAWKKEFANKLRALKDDADLSRGVENNLFRAPPEYGGHAITMNRGQLRAVMLNLGNESNIKKLSKGWGLDPEAIKTWVLAKADKADWDFVQGVWDIFDEAKERADTMVRSISGVPAESIEASPIATPHGTYRGGYYPIIYHENYAKVPKLMEVGLTQDGFESASTPQGYTKTRTGFYAPLSMNIDRLPNRLSQMIHDTALRPAVLNAAKVFRDPQIQAAITTHYGREYTKMMIPWLRNIANAANSSAMTPFSSAMEFVRQNMITALVGLNPGTVMKHGPTAMGLSIKEVGGARFASAVRTMFSQSEDAADSNWNFAIKHSLELQRRDRNWQETLYGATGELVPGTKFGAWRQKVMEWSSKPVALSDMMSAVPTWLAQYSKAIDEGKPHGDAVFEADRAVRRAHGSMAVTNRPMITHWASPWLTSVYNFFNDIMNRQIETLWKAGEMTGAAKQGDWAQAKKYIAPVVGGVMAYAIWPALVEHMVQPQDSNPQDSWAKKAAKGMVYTLGASYVGVRDIANAVLEGKEPDVGLATTAGRSAVDAFRDLGKKEPFTPAHAEKMIRDAGSLVGLLTGVPNQISRELSFGYGLSQGIERPQGPWGWLVGARYGTLRGHSQTLDQYLRGQYDRRR